MYKILKCNRFNEITKEKAYRGVKCVDYALIVYDLEVHSWKQNYT
jgi:hypothetical protein